tara:strand:- start:2336 stop:2524 length:189 start_codon:yes stop_codon:yes gene_type:complete
MWWETHATAAPIKFTSKPARRRTTPTHTVLWTVLCAITDDPVKKIDKNISTRSDYNHVLLKR